MKVKKQAEEARTSQSQVTTVRCFLFLLRIGKSKAFIRQSFSLNLCGLLCISEEVFIPYKEHINCPNLS